MNKVNRNLLIALAVQLVLVLLLNLRGNETSIGKFEPVVAGFSKDKVERIRVFDRTAKPGPGEAPEEKSDAKGKPGENPSIDLAKKGDAWVLASHYGYPVDTQKVTDLLDKIEGMRSRGAIASGKARQKQLEVADDSYQRKVVVTAGGADTTIYVGSSAGSRQTSVRLAGRDDIHGVTGLTAFSVGAAPSAWVDGNYVNVEIHKIDTFDVVNANGTFHFERAAAGEGWTPSLGGQPLAPPAGMEINKPEIEKVVARAAQVFLTEPADPKRTIDKPLATVTLRIKAEPTPPAPGAPAGADAGATPAESKLAEDRVIEIAATDKKDRYYVREKGRDQAALVDALSVTDLVELSRDRLLAKIGEKKAEAEGHGGLPAEGLPPGFDPSQLGQP